MCHRIWSKSLAFGETPCAGNPVKRLMVALASALCLITGAWGATYDLNYYNGQTSTSSFTAGDGSVITGTMTRAFGVYISDGATVTLRNARIDGASLNADKPYAGLNCIGNATIIIEGDDNYLSGFQSGRPGIRVREGYTVTIKGTGTLVAMGNGNAAGIGGGENESDSKCGKIVIEDTPTITATGGGGSAGIGGGGEKSCDDITIRGGTITARGGNSGGAGIGGGRSGQCGDISISGGTILAYGGYDTSTGVSAPGIGAGDGTSSAPASCGNITITSGITSVRAIRNANGTSWAIGHGKTNSSHASRTIADGLLSITTANSDLVTHRIYRWDGNLGTIPSSATSVTAFDGTTITGTLLRDCKISIAADAKVYLTNAIINRASSSSTPWAGLSCLSNAMIWVYGENTINSPGDHYPGIFVPKGSMLEIFGNDTSVLNVKGSAGGAGIGGGYQIDCGNIYLDGLVVNATGTYYAAGIGGGYEASCGYISIPKATVTATGAQYGAGIGSGYVGSCGSIHMGIAGGGTITATGGEGAAGIGSGQSATTAASLCGYIMIGAISQEAGSGITVEAKGGTGAAGIGSGRGTSSSASECGYVEITEYIALVKGRSGSSGINGIGAGQNSTCGTLCIPEGLLERNIIFSDGRQLSVERWNGRLNDVPSGDKCVKAYNGMTITGKLSSDCKILIDERAATVTLKNAIITNGTYNSSCMWAGITCLGHTWIMLEGENKIKGFNELYPGIYVPEGKTLTIDSVSNGSLDASSNGRGAGIGAGYEIPCGSIVINGGTVTASSSLMAAGIGGAYHAACSNIVIRGGTVMAIGGTHAAGIGGGKLGACGKIQIQNNRLKSVEASVNSIYSPNAIGAGADGTGGSVEVLEGLIDTSSSEGNKLTRKIYPWDGDLSLSTVPDDVLSVTAFDATVITGTLSRNCKIEIPDYAVVTLSNAVINGTSNSDCKWAGLTCKGQVHLINIEGTNIVKGFYEDYPGIFIAKGGTLRIYSSSGTGKLDARSNGWAAGIGAGYSSSNQPDKLACGSIAIASGTVTATGGKGAAGIGGALRSSCDQIAIGPDVTLVQSTCGDPDSSGNTPEPIGAGAASTVSSVYIDSTLADRTVDKTRTIGRYVNDSYSSGGVTWYFRTVFGEAEICRNESPDGPAVSPEPSGVLEIPSTLGGCPVTRIGAGALAGCSGVLELKIPDSVAVLDASAIYGCSSMTTLTIPAVTDIGTRAFSWDNALNTVYVPSAALTSVSNMIANSQSGLDMSRIKFIGIGGTYEVWASANGLSGAWDAVDANGVANVFRYVFDVPDGDFTEEAMLDITFDENGKAVVKTPELVNGSGVFSITVIASDNADGTGNVVYYPLDGDGTTTINEVEKSSRFFRLRAEIIQ